MLAYLSNFFLIIGSFFMVSAIVGLMRYKDFYIKLHTLSMFNIYGVSSVLFALAIKTYHPIVFFEILFLIVINVISTLAVISILFRNAILNNVKYKAKTRDDITQEEMLEAKNRIDFVINDDTIEKAKKDLRNKLTEKDKAKLEKIYKKEEEKKLKEKLKEEKKNEKEKLKEEKKKEKEKLKEEKKHIKEDKKKEDKKKEDKKKEEKKEGKDVKHTQTKVESKPAVIKTETPKQEVKAEKEPVKTQEPKKEMSDIEKENEELRKKIREQKKILRKKIETVRRNAFITRKPEEIQKAEDLIKGILDKYHLTEDMLKDDYED